LSPPLVHIHYLRPPDRTDVFRQHLILDRDDVKVTLAQDLAFDPPIEIEGAIALETGSSAVWFTFPETWHDIGIFHRADGTFTGTYANILTPPVFEAGHVWRTTDLYLDVWIEPGGRLWVLDREQFDEAVAADWIDAETAVRALSEVEAIVTEYGTGRWPPPVVGEWTLDRAIQAASATNHP
jgi:predicted RNA-binding protein associated with RNAse of E/G family